MPTEDDVGRGQSTQKYQRKAATVLETLSKRLGEAEDSWERFLTERSTRLALESAAPLGKSDRKEWKGALVALLRQHREVLLACQDLEGLNTNQLQTESLGVRLEVCTRRLLGLPPWLLHLAKSHFFPLIFASAGALDLLRRGRGEPHFHLLEDVCRVATDFAVIGGTTGLPDAWEAVRLQVHLLEKEQRRARPDVGIDWNSRVKTISMLVRLAMDVPAHADLLDVEVLKGLTLAWARRGEQAWFKDGWMVLQKLVEVCELVGQSELGAEALALWLLSEGECWWRGPKKELSALLSCRLLDLLNKASRSSNPTNLDLASLNSNNSKSTYRSKGNSNNDESSGSSIKNSVKTNLSLAFEAAAANTDNDSSNNNSNNRTCNHALNINTDSNSNSAHADIKSVSTSTNSNSSSTNNSNNNDSSSNSPKKDNANAITATLPPTPKRRRRLGVAHSPGMFGMSQMLGPSNDNSETSTDKQNSSSNSKSSSSNRSTTPSQTSNPNLQPNSNSISASGQGQVPRLEKQLRPTSNSVSGSSQGQVVNQPSSNPISAISQAPRNVEQQLRPNSTPTSARAHERPSEAARRWCSLICSWQRQQDLGPGSRRAPVEKLKDMLLRTAQLKAMSGTSLASSDDSVDGWLVLKGLAMDLAEDADAESSKENSTQSPEKSEFESLESLNLDPPSLRAACAEALLTVSSASLAWLPIEKVARGRKLGGSVELALECALSALSLLRQNSAGHLVEQSMAGQNHFLEVALHWSQSRFSTLQMELLAALGSIYERIGSLGWSNWYFDASLHYLKQARPLVHSSHWEAKYLAAKARLKLSGPSFSQSSSALEAPSPELPRPELDSFARTPPPKSSRKRTRSAHVAYATSSDSPERIVRTPCDSKRRCPSTSRGTGGGVEKEVRQTPFRCRSAAFFAAVEEALNCPSLCQTDQAELLARNLLLLLNPDSSGLFPDMEEVLSTHKCRLEWLAAWLTHPSFEVPGRSLFAAATLFLRLCDQASSTGASLCVHLPTKDVILQRLLKAWPTFADCGGLRADFGWYLLSLAEALFPTPEALAQLSVGALVRALQFSANLVGKSREELLREILEVLTSEFQDEEKFKAALALVLAGLEISLEAGDTLAAEAAARRLSSWALTAEASIRARQHEGVLDSSGGNSNNNNNNNNSCSSNSANNSGSNGCSSNSANNSNHSDSSTTWPSNTFPSEGPDDYSAGGILSARAAVALTGQATATTRIRTKIAKTTAKTTTAAAAGTTRTTTTTMTGTMTSVIMNGLDICKTNCAMEVAENDASNDFVAARSTSSSSSSSTFPRAFSSPAAAAAASSDFCSSSPLPPSSSRPRSQALFARDRPAAQASLCANILATASIPFLTGLGADMLQAVGATAGAQAANEVADSLGRRTLTSMLRGDWMSDGSSFLSSSSCFSATSSEEAEGKGRGEQEDSSEETEGRGETAEEEGNEGRGGLAGRDPEATTTATATAATAATTQATTAAEATAQAKAVAATSSSPSSAPAAAVGQSERQVMAWLCVDGDAIIVARRADGPPEWRELLGGRIVSRRLEARGHRLLDLRDEVLRITAENQKSVKQMSATAGQTPTKAQCHQFWRRRRHYDEQLRFVVEKIAAEALGPWRFMLSAWWRDQNIDDTRCRMNQLTTMASKLGLLVPEDATTRYLLLLLLQQPSSLSIPELAEVLSELILPAQCREPSRQEDAFNELAASLHAIEVPPLVPTSPAPSLLLFFDRDCRDLPLEACPFLSDRLVVRGVAPLLSTSAAIARRTRAVTSTRTTAAARKAAATTTTTTKIDPTASRMEVPHLLLDAPSPWPQADTQEDGQSRDRQQQQQQQQQQHQQHRHQQQKQQPLQKQVQDSSMDTRPCESYYVLDPFGTLSAGQKLHQFLENPGSASFTKWRGTMGPAAHATSTDSLVKRLTNSKLFLFLGHGADARALLPANPLRGLPTPATAKRRHALARRPLSATALLLGCRTAANRQPDERDERAGEVEGAGAWGAVATPAGKARTPGRAMAAATPTAAAATATTAAAAGIAAGVAAAASIAVARPATTDTAHMASRHRPNRDFEGEEFGLPVDLLLGGAPAAIGALWDVLGGDLERFGLSLLQRWCTNEGSPPSALSDVHFLWALRSARAQCELKTLTGGAVVCYGLPPPLT